MSKPLVVSIPHNLGQAEALRRIKSGIERVKTKYASFGTFDEEVWTDNHLDFKVSALRQSMNGGVDVEPDSVVMTLELPWVLSVLTEKARALITKHGNKMLTKGN